MLNIFPCPPNTIEAFTPHTRTPMHPQKPRRQVVHAGVERGVGIPKPLPHIGCAMVMIRVLGVKFIQ